MLGRVGKCRTGYGRVEWLSVLPLFNLFHRLVMSQADSFVGEGALSSNDEALERELGKLLSSTYIVYVCLFS